MNKIFGIGLSRTGTTSLNQALQELGYNSKHYPRNMREIAEHDAATDAFVACRFRELDRLYPGSKFILTIRNKTDWLRSMKWLFEKSAPLDRMEIEYKQIVSGTRKRLYGTDKYEIDKLEAAFDRHHEEVLSFFSDRNDLIVIDICAGDDYKKLCPFLGKPIPTSEFPSLNKRS